MRLRLKHLLLFCTRLSRTGRIRDAIDRNAKHPIIEDTALTRRDIPQATNSQKPIQRRKSIRGAPSCTIVFGSCSLLSSLQMVGQ